MTAVHLSEALTREHRDIDAGIEAFTADLDSDVVRPEPLLTAFAALRRHIYLEEEFLFPPIRQAGLMMPVLVMLREHGELWQSMDTIIQLLESNDDGDVPDPRLASTCADLLARLDQHSDKEEPIIYPHADTDLDDESTAALAEFLRTGRTPEGWRCETAP